MAAAFISLKQILTVVIAVVTLKKNMEIGKRNKSTLPALSIL